MRRIAELIYTRRSVRGDMPVEQVMKLLEAEPQLDALATLEATRSLPASARLLSRHPPATQQRQAPGQDQERRDQARQLADDRVLAERAQG